MMAHDEEDFEAAYAAWELFALLSRHADRLKPDTRALLARDFDVTPDEYVALGEGPLPDYVTYVKTGEWPR